MARKTSLSQIEFQESLRKQQACEKRPSLSQKHDQEFIHLSGILKQHVKTIEKGDYNQVCKSLSQFMTDEKQALRKYIIRDMFVPQHVDSIGEKLLRQTDYWILLLISFEQFAKKGEAQDAQFSKVMSKMRSYLDPKMAQEVEKQAYNFSMKGGDKPNFLRNPLHFTIAEENSNLAQCSCTSQKEQSLKQEKNHQHTQGTQIISEIPITNTQFTQTEDVQKDFDEISEIKQDSQLKPFVRGRIWVQDLRQQKKELEELINEDQEQHERERAEITNKEEKSLESRKESQFYSLQRVNNQKQKKSFSLVNHVDKEKQKWGFGKLVTKRESRSKTKDNQKVFQYKRSSLRLSKGLIKQDIVQENLNTKEKFQSQNQTKKQADPKKSKCIQTISENKRLSTVPQVQECNSMKVSVPLNE